ANREAAAGLFQRHEWEAPIASDTPDLRATRHTALDRLNGKKLARTLKPVFETRVHRTVLPVRRNGSRIQLTLDQGLVQLGRKSMPINEVELELKRGHAADLFAVARELTGRMPARFAVSSKADRGYALVDDEPIAAVRRHPISLDPRMSAGAAF